MKSRISRQVRTRLGRRRRVGVWHRWRWIQRAPDFVASRDALGVWSSGARPTTSSHYVAARSCQPAPPLPPLSTRPRRRKSLRHRTMPGRMPQRWRPLRVGAPPTGTFGCVCSVPVSGTPFDREGGAVLLATRYPDALDRIITEIRTGEVWATLLLPRTSPTEPASAPSSTMSLHSTCSAGLFNDGGVNQARCSVHLRVPPGRCRVRRRGRHRGQQHSNTASRVAEAPGRATYGCSGFASPSSRVPSSQSIVARGREGPNMMNAPVTSHTAANSYYYRRCFHPTDLGDSDPQYTFACDDATNRLRARRRSRGRNRTRATGVALKISTRAAVQGSAPDPLVHRCMRG